MSGPATRKILEREFGEYGNSEYERLAGISVAHLYRLRKSKTYRTRQATFTKTRPTTVAIGERRCRQPEGRPGYLRVDTVHQGDRDGVKGVYHINAVDEVTQRQAVACVPQISEAWLEPALYSMLAQFPFKIRDFTPTTAANSSITSWRRCSRNYWSNRPRAGLGDPTTTG